MKLSTDFVQIDIPVAQFFFDQVNDIDNNGVLSPGDQIIFAEETINLGEEVRSLRNTVAVMNAISPREFVLSKSYGSQEFFYLAYSDENDTSKLAGIFFIGGIKKSNEEPFFQITLANIANQQTDLSLRENELSCDPSAISLWHYFETPEKYVKLQEEYNQNITEIGKNWQDSQKLKSSLSRNNSILRLLDHYEEVCQDFR